jgi:hypothetical protein
MRPRALRWMLLLIGLLGAVTPAVAQSKAVDPVAARIAAAIDALALGRALDNRVWSSGNYSWIDDKRPDWARTIRVWSWQVGLDHRIVSPFTDFDQLLLGVAGGRLKATSQQVS